MAAPRRHPPLPSWVAGLRRAGLLQDPVLVLGDAELARSLARTGLRVQTEVPGRSAPPTFASVLDFAWTAARPPARRRAAVRDLADVVTYRGALHVRVPREATALQPPGPAWSLLTVHDVGGGWVATFVHAPETRGPGPRGRAQAVRHFSDLGAFGSLDLGASTDRSSDT